MRSRYTKTFLTKKLSGLFSKSGAILVYLFGSHVKGRIGPLSDVDIAVLWNEGEKDTLVKELSLQRQLKDLLRDERIELGSLNGQDLSFCYNVIKDGKCIFGREEDRIRYETYILNEYLDFQYLADIYNKAFSEAMLKQK